MSLFGDKIIDCKNDSISWLCHSIKNFVAKFLFVKWTSSSNFVLKKLKSVLFTPKFPIKASYIKFQFECGVHNLAIKKEALLVF